MTYYNPESSRDSNQVLMATYGWPEEIENNPFIAAPPKEEPNQEISGNLCAIFHDEDETWICGNPERVEP